MIKKAIDIYRFLKPTIILIISIFLHYIIPISSCITFIDKTFYYTIDISIYTALLSAIFNKIENELKKKQEEINIIYYNKKDKGLFSDPCTLNVNSKGYERLFIQVIIEGKMNSKKEDFLKFKFPNYVAVSSEKGIFCGEIKENCLSINLKDIADQKTGHDFVVEFDLEISQIARFKGSATIESFLEKKSIMATLNNINRLQVKTTEG